MFVHHSGGDELLHRDPSILVDVEMVEPVPDLCIAKVGCSSTEAAINVSL